MSKVKDAAESLEAALRTVSGVTVYRDPGASLNTPALVLMPPSLQWEGVCDGPTSARFLVFAVVDANEYAVERLWDLVTEVGQAIDSYTNAVVVSADPAAYPSGATQLPCYELTAEVSL